MFDIAALVEETLDAAERQGAICPAQSLDDILAVDELARHLSNEKLSGY